MAKHPQRLIVRERNREDEVNEKKERKRKRKKRVTHKKQEEKKKKVILQETTSICRYSFFLPLLNCFCWRVCHPLTFK